MIVKNNPARDKIFRAKNGKKAQLQAEIMQWHGLCYNFHIRGNEAMSASDGWHRKTDEM